MSAGSVGQSWVTPSQRDQRPMKRTTTEECRAARVELELAEDLEPEEDAELEEGEDGWVQAVAGIQFVMRLPQHARDEISVGKSQLGGAVTAKENAVPIKEKAAKFDLFSHFALWAHNLGKPPRQLHQLTANAEQFRRLLRLAGFELTLHNPSPKEPEPKSPDAESKVRQLHLESPPPEGETVLDPDEEESPELEPEFPDGNIEGQQLHLESPLPEGETVLDPDEEKSPESEPEFRKGYIEVRQLHLERPPPKGETVLDPDKEKSPEKAFRKLDSKRLAHLRVDPPLIIHHKQAEPGNEEGEDQYPRMPWSQICWFPVVSTKDLPDGRTKGYKDKLTEDLHELYKQLRNKPRNKKTLTSAINNLIYTAYGICLGSGEEDSKKAFLQSKVQSIRLERSGRAVITPRGSPFDDLPLTRTIDEISIPFVIARTIVPDLVCDSTLSEVNSRLGKSDNRVWIKRDPLLHRWGLLPVRFVVNSGHTIQLPASILDALGADYDGDTVSVFAVEWGKDHPSSELWPTKMRQHELWGKPMFAPSKQFVYGLHLLEKNDKSLQEFRDFLRSQDAAEWPTEGTTKEKLVKWVQETFTRNQSKFEQEPLIESYSLRALGLEPGMQLGLYHDAGEIAKLDVVKCGAAKRELYESDDGSTPKMARYIVQGRSLDLHEQGIDPIGKIMVKAEPLKGEFGNIIKHLVYNARELSEGKNKDGKSGNDFLEAAQALCERLSQKTLSVKAVDSELPDPRENREKILRPIAKGQKPEKGKEASPGDDKESPIDEFKREIVEAGIWDILSSNLMREPEPWMRWLFAPHELRSILAKLEQDAEQDPKQDAEQDPKQEAVLRLPLHDMRCWPFVSVAGS